MEADRLARILKLPLSQLGRRFVLAEVLGEPVSRRGPRLRAGGKAKDSSAPEPEPPAQAGGG